MSKPKLKSVNAVFVILAAFFMTACTEAKEPTWEPDPEPGPAAYTPPIYPDDYRPYGSWTMKLFWGPYNVHDPSMEKDGEYYYVFGTNASYGNEHMNPVGTPRGLYMSRRSKDLVNWEYLGFALPTTPEWVLDSLNNIRVREGRVPIPDHHIEDPSKLLNYGYWAPCVRKVGDKFRLYYSIFVDDIPINYPNAKRYASKQWDCWTERAFIGWAEADRLQGPWTDKGMVVLSVPDGEGVVERANGNWSAYWGFNAIDPTFMEDPQTGRHWLIFGSWHTGIAAIELDPATGKTIKDPFSIESYKKVAQRSSTSRWQALEAPEVTYNPKTGYYYLFLAYDELGFRYNTRVGRSAEIDGTYKGSNGRDVTRGWDAYPIVTHPYKFESDHGWQGISHCCVYYDKDLDKWFYNSQGRPSGEENLTYCMVQHIHEMIWTHGEENPEDDGWPVVVPERYAAVPQTDITESDIAGEWDVILIKYEAGKHNISGKYIFNENKTFSVAGSDAGTWTFSAEEKVLTIDWKEKGIKDRLYVQDAVDWEASPRVTTITFTGLTSDQAPSNFATSKVHQRWGKKIK